MRSTGTKPRFLHTHTGPKHSQNSGVCRDNETARFAERRRVANAEMKQDIETILQSDRDGIIIANGDHGPYLTKNCHVLKKAKHSAASVTTLDIQDRYGAFLAIRWPDRNYLQFDDVMILQDVFPAVFAYMFRDPSLLQAKMENMITGAPINGLVGVTVDDGVISGGADDGERLFESMSPSGARPP